MENSGLPKNKQYPKSLIPDNVDYDSFVTLANFKNNVADYVDVGNCDLYICSKETGNGKTSWAIKILLSYFDKIWAGNGFRIRGRFQHVPTLFNTLKDFSQSHDALKCVLRNADIVIWDDVAATKLSDYDIMQLLTILDERIDYGKTNIYTSNITTMRLLESVVGSRLASRIWNNSTIVEFKGKDRRNGNNN